MIKHTTFRDLNGNRRVKIEIDTIGALYAEFCKGARIQGDAALSFDAVLARLKSRFGYRIQRKAKTPNVTAVFETETEMTNEVFDAIVYTVTDGRVEHSRRRYMNGVRRCSHNDYYAQFITPSVMGYVQRIMPDLLTSRKECFNDLKDLTNFVTLRGEAAELCRIAESTTYSGFRGGNSLSNGVCVYKAAARLALIEHLERYDTAYKESLIADDISIVEYRNGFHFKQYDKAIAPHDALLQLKCRVSVRFDNDVYKMIANYMFIDSNKAMLRRIVENSSAVNVFGGTLENDHLVGACPTHGAV